MGAFGRAMIPLTGGALQGLQTYNMYNQQALNNKIQQQAMQLEQQKAQFENLRNQTEQRKMDEEIWKDQYQVWQDKSSRLAGANMYRKMAEQLAQDPDPAVRAKAQGAQLIADAYQNNAPDVAIKSMADYYQIGGDPLKDLKTQAQITSLYAGAGKSGAQAGELGNLAQILKLVIDQMNKNKAGGGAPTSIDTGGGVSLDLGGGGGAGAPAGGGAPAAAAPSGTEAAAAAPPAAAGGGGWSPTKVSDKPISDRSLWGKTKTGKDGHNYFIDKTGIPYRLD
jgi:hypothetical protein